MTHIENTHLLNALKNAAVFTNEKQDRFSNIYIRSLSKEMIEVTSNDDGVLYCATVQYGNPGDISIRSTHTPLHMFSQLHNTGKFNLDEVVEDMYTIDMGLDCSGRQAFLDFFKSTGNSDSSFSIEAGTVSKLSKVKGLGGKKLGNVFKFTRMQDSFLIQIVLDQDQTVYVANVPN